MAKELSIFVDESGDRAGITRYYLICLVFHDQSCDIKTIVSKYEHLLLESDLPNVPFHSEPLLNGRKDYEDLSLTQRKKLLSCFATLVRHLPISYIPLVYKRSEHRKPTELAQRMGRDISNLINENLDFFQKFDKVKVYYDNGQDIVKQAIDESLNSVLSAGVFLRRKTSMTDYRLEQVADYLCTIELAAVKYAAHEDGATYNKFFGGVGAFKKNWLKQARRKLLR